MGFEAHLGVSCGGEAFCGGAEERVCGGLERGDVRDLDGPVGSEEAGGEGGEVAHVGAEEDWSASSDRLGGVLATAGTKAFPDEYDGGTVIPTHEFAGGIHEEHVGI